MGDADKAWQEWQESPEGQTADPDDWELIFMAGYRRALEDAADAISVETDRSTVPTEMAVQWLRARAASVGTKDGASDHE